MISRVTNWLNVQDSRYIFLLLLLVVLPSFEAPKNLFALLYVFSWLFIAYREKNWGGKWRLIDTIISFLLFGSIVVSINAVIIHDFSAKGITDLIRYLLIFWVLSRHILTNKQITILCMVAVFSTAISLIYSFIMCPQGGICLELNSVGHVNHSAIYLVIAYSIALSLLLINFFVLPNYQKTLLILSTLFIAYATVDAHSRAASGLFFFVTLLGFFYAVVHYKNWRFGLMTVLILILGSYLTDVPKFTDDLIKTFKTSQSLSDVPGRKNIRNFSYYAFKTYPMLGVGFGNFNNLGHEHIKDKVIEDLGIYEKEKYAPYVHTHNVYYNFLVSGGIVMFSAFLWFFAQIIISIWKVRKQNNRKELRYIDNVEVIEYRDDRFLILSSSMVVLIVLSIGFVNTTLNHEHAILSMFVLGLLISKDREINAK
ncbi:hypothetical protein OAK82_02415 [Candidatus Thioglobus sp.]|nr:hypothetical protein [Candidatus Thioglobus sp.]